MTIRLHTRYQNSAGQRVYFTFNRNGIDYAYVAALSVSSGACRANAPQVLMPAPVVDGGMTLQASGSESQG